MATLTPNQDTEVTIRKQGETKVFIDTDAMGGIGQQTKDFVVPTGKKWILKGYQWDNGSCTVTSISIRILIFSAYTQFTLYNDTVDFSILLTTEIFLKEGDILRYFANVSNDGPCSAIIMVEEYDA